MIFSYSPFTKHPISWDGIEVVTQFTPTTTTISEVHRKYLFSDPAEALCFNEFWNQQVNVSPKPVYQCLN